jgi:hypothetical protein
MLISDGPWRQFAKAVFFLRKRMKLIAWQGLWRALTVRTLAYLARERESFPVLSRLRVVERQQRRSVVN